MDIAFVSRDVTGLSTKHVLTEELLAFYAVLRRSEALQWVHIHSAGADRPIYPELRARGVSVCTSSGANAEVVAQTALAGLLALARRFPQLMAAQQARTWAPLVGEAQAPRDLAGQTAVLVGWGPIGQGLGAFLRLLGLKLVVVRQNLPRAATEAGVEMVSFPRFAHGAAARGLADPRLPADAADPRPGESGGPGCAATRGLFDQCGQRRSGGRAGLDRGLARGSPGWRLPGCVRT